MVVFVKNFQDVGTDFLLLDIECSYIRDGNFFYLLSTYSLVIFFLSYF